MIQHFEKFDKPISLKEFHSFVINKNYYNYHPAGYGGGAKIVTEVIKINNKTTYITKWANQNDTSTMWVWEHSNSCD